MGKSPAKWFKTVLFGKKSSRSSSSKKSAKEGESKNGLSTLGGESPVISYPLPVNKDQSATSESRKEPSSILPSDGVARLPVQEEETKGTANSCPKENITKNEEAAIKVQAMFRGYLARRAFHSLWGVIRLQSLFRGHLVRRQAVITLRCVQAIVKLQAIARGRRVRQSNIGLEVHKKLSKANSRVAKSADYPSSNAESQVVDLSSNKFVNKLLSLKRTSKVLRMQYAKGEPNSSWNWLDRWSCTQFWKPTSLPKKSLDSKPKGRLVGYALETESGKLKRGSRKNYSSDNGSMVATSESEKSKRNPRKVGNAEVIPEQPQSELEKVKRNLRKISSYTQTSDTADGESDRFKKAVKSVVSTQVDVPEIAPINSGEKLKKENIEPSVTSAPTLTVNYQSSEAEVCMEDDEKYASDPKKEELIAVTSEDNNVVSSAHNNDSNKTESYLLSKDENHYPVSGHVGAEDERVCVETLKTSKRRASFSAKLENAENGSPNTPTLPSYMAATQSAKAKLRGQISPRFSSDEIDKNGFVRRHSLPSSTNGKLGPRPDQNTLKGGRGERSFSSSKDGNDYPIRAEWKR